MFHYNRSIDHFNREHPVSPSQRRSSTALSMLALATLVAGAPFRVAAAQDVMDARSTRYLLERYVADMDTVHVKIMALANAIPEDKYSWRPTQGVRSVSEVLMHIASEWLYYGPLSVGGKPPADFGPPRETLPKLERDYTKKAEAAFVMTGDQHEHLGQLIAYARWVGVKPPWST